MTTLLQSPTFSISSFLEQEREKDILRFSTAGSVDDGKSTLIGRLLYDTQSVYDDQVRSIEGKGTTAPGQIDFALLTDGLRAEREQGITIDVAYRYFSTPRRKFIIADTPGHEQYTRNMATGASTADAAVVLIDARKGVLIQSRRHAFIASLLGVRHIVVAVNKMDLVGYDEAAFRAIERDFTAVLAQIAAQTGVASEAVFIPVSALLGDNVVHRSAVTPWYVGRSLLEVLETLPAPIETSTSSFRFPVQRVLRPDHSFRGFSGQIASGVVRPGDGITVMPSGRSAYVSRIVTYDGDLDQARAPLSVTLVLDRELDISRGDLLISADAPAAITDGCRAALVWMDERPLLRGHRYMMKHTSQTVPAVIAALEHRTDVSTLAADPPRSDADTLQMNGIGVARLELLRPIALDRYADNRATGAFILIDPESNRTVAAGMVREPLARRTVVPKTSRETSRVSAEDRQARWGHRGGVLELRGPAALIDGIERSLFESGVIAVRSATAEQAAWLASVGLLALSVVESDVESDVETDEHWLRARVNQHHVQVPATDTEEAETAIRGLLDLAGITHRAGITEFTEKAESL